MNETRGFPEKIKPGRKLTSIHDHVYYGPLIDLYIKSILKSGLLLDEDLEALLSVSDLKSFPDHGVYRPSLSLLASTLSMVGCSLLAKRYDMPLLLILPALFVGKSLAIEFKNVRRKKSNREIVDKLIEVINKIHKLNISIIRYMKTRKDLGKVGNSTLVILHDKSLKEFLKVVLTNEYHLFQFIMDSLKNIAVYSDELSDDYRCFVCLNPLSILETADANNIEDCLTLIQSIQDLHVLFASKFLSYVGVVCCSETSTLHEKDLDSFVNKKFPNLIKRFHQNHDVIKKQFVALRNSVNKKSEYKLQARVKTSNSRELLPKLQDALVYSVNNLSVILEKSQCVLDRLESNEEIDLKEVDTAIIDLRNHTFATYESLDVLCKLYGIISNFGTAKQTENKITNSIQTTKDPEQKLPTVNYDDSTETLEEKFELYVGNEDAEIEFPTTNYEEGRPGEYLNLMLRELRQSLKQHQRFIDAKKRRGSEGDEDVINKDSGITLRQSPPKFNLSAIKAESSQVNISMLPPALELEEKNVNVNVKPMPPPPPLPSFNLVNLEEESGQINARSMLDNIKVLSSQRNVQEDVFGDSDIDSSCSTDG